MKKWLAIGLILWFSVSLCLAQNNRSVAILNLDARNSIVGNSFINAVDQIAKISGFSYFITDQVDSAVKSSMIIASSRMAIGTFSTAEESMLQTYVDSGGIMIGSALQTNSTFLKRLFGFSAFTNSKTQHHLFFTDTLGTPGLRWLDDSLERALSLGDELIDTVIQVTWYTPNGAYVAARYDNDSAAVLINYVGKGVAMAFGTGFRDLISTSQQDLDFKAERFYSNFFEPGYDPIVFFIKDFLAKRKPMSVWKHTIPNKKNTAVLLTHDMDSQTSNELATVFSRYERRKGITATYNITARYFSDFLMGAIYDNPSRVKLDSAFRVYGMVLASHSVGHFPDMDNELVFPLGHRTGNDTSNYKPRYNGASSITIGGNIYGELQVSKQLIESSCRCEVRSFRTGYLTFHDKLVNALDTSGYEFSSSMSANDVMTNFPYRTRTDRSNSGIYTKVYELPLTISDVFLSDPITDSNYLQKLEIWKKVTDKLAANFSPVNLLIHPNRDYKLDALQLYVSHLNPYETDYSGFENYAEFWRYRDSLQFTSSLDGDSLRIVIDERFLPIKYALGFVVDGARKYIDSSKIMVESSLGLNIPYYVYPWYDSSYYIMFEPFTEPSAVGISEDKIHIDTRDFRVYPNPFDDHVTIEIFVDEPCVGRLEIYALDGSLLYKNEYSLEEDKNLLIPELPNKLAAGQYTFMMHTKQRIYSARLIHP